MNETVCGFLERHGFTQSEMKGFVLRRPDILTTNPQTSLAPHLLPLLEMGLSPSDITDVILSANRPIHYPSLLSRITFWMDFYDHNEAAVVHAMKHNKGLIDEDTCVGVPFLLSHGFSPQEIQKIIYEVPNFITSGEERMEDLLTRAKELGFQRESENYLVGLRFVLEFNRTALKRKMGMYKSFGWPEDEFLPAALKYPVMMSCSKERLGAMMDFFLKEAGMDLSYLVRRPDIMNFSLKERLRPRLCVLRVLESKGLFKFRRGKKFRAVAIMDEGKFLEKYVRPHEKKIPELHETYVASNSR